MAMPVVVRIVLEVNVSSNHYESVGGLSIIKNNVDMMAGYYK